MKNKTIKELKEIAKELHVKNWWSLNKAKLIEEIKKIQDLSDEEKEKVKEETKQEQELFEHYQKYWKKYGPKNDWVKFLKDYKAGKITLIEEEEAPKTQFKAPTAQSKEVSEESKQNNKAEAKRANKKLTELTYKGETKSIRAWAEDLGMPWPTLYDRVNRNGWSVEDAIEIPLGQRRKK